MKYLSLEDYIFNPVFHGGIAGAAMIGAATAGTAVIADLAGCDAAYSCNVLSLLSDFEPGYKKYLSAGLLGMYLGMQIGNWAGILSGIYVYSSQVSEPEE